MPHVIPDQFIISTTIQYEVEGGLYDIEVTHTAFGEVKSAVSHILELPWEAVAMTIGKDAEYVLEEIKQHFAQIRFYLPLVAVGIVQQDPWQEVRLQMERLRTAPTFDEMVSRDHIDDQWVRYLWELKEQGAEDKLKWVYQLLSSPEELLKRSPSPFNEDNFRLAEPILFQFLEFYDLTDYHEALIGVLGHYRSALLPPHLLRQLVTIRDGKDDWLPLYGLSFYQSQEILEQLLRYYKRHRLTRGKAGAYLIRSLAQYPDERARSIVFEALVGDDAAIGTAAFEGLSKAGVGKEEMAVHLKKAFQQLFHIDDIRNVLFQYRNLQAPHLLPEAEELLALLYRINGRTKDKLVYECFFDLLIEKADSRINGQVIRSMEVIRNQALQSAALPFLGKYGGVKELKLIVFFLEEGIINASVSADPALCAMIDRHFDPEMIAPIARMQQHEDHRLRSMAARAMVHILWKNQDIELANRLVDEVRKESVSTQKELVPGLAKLPWPENEQLLQKMKDTGEEEVTQLADLALQQLEAKDRETSVETEHKEEKNGLLLIMAVLILLSFLWFKYCN
ncbi:MAG: hypothetical protein R2824_14240 [Saprospiraceae bacterium]|nr:hypothetical protein [Lewinella sp.]